MSTPSEHFGWVRHYEDPEGFWEDQEARKRARREAAERALEARQQASSKTSVAALLSSLRSGGLLRDDRLSYTRICELERETGITNDSWSDFHASLREAQRKDEELRSS